MDDLLTAKAELNAEKFALKQAGFKTLKHEANDDVIQRNFYQKKRLAEFAPDFSI